jgi:hypothetical protein
MPVNYYFVVFFDEGYQAFKHFLSSVLTRRIGRLCFFGWSIAPFLTYLLYTNPRKKAIIFYRICARER